MLHQDVRTYACPEELIKEMLLALIGPCTAQVRLRRLPFLPFCESLYIYTGHSTLSTTPIILEQASRHPITRKPHTPSEP